MQRWVDGRAALVISALVAGVASSCLLSCGSDVVVRGAYARGIDLYDQGDLHGAVAEYRAALNESPDDYRVHYNLGLAYHDLFKRARDTGSPDAATMRQLAEDRYRTVLKLSSGNPRAISSLAVLMRDDGRPDDAVALLETAEPSAAEGRALPWWTLGVLHRDAGRSEEAEAAFRRALELDPADLGSCTALAAGLIDTGRLDEADELITAALKVHPFDFTLGLKHAEVAIRRARGLSYEEREGRTVWEEARRRMSKAQALLPGDWKVAVGLAEIQAARGDVREAVRALWAARDAVSDEQLRRAGEDPEAWRRNVAERLLGLYSRLAEAERRVASR